MNKIPITVLIPTKNEERNIRPCLNPLIGWADQIIVVDSNSKDDTIKIVKSFSEIETVKFIYNGGWPKKRQWALDNLNIRNEWVLLLDVDEILLPGVKNEIGSLIEENRHDGFYIFLQVEFLGKALQYSHPGLYKLSLFRKGYGNFERRIEDQDESMADMEIHEHILVNGKVGKLKNPILHRNLNSIHRYIEKHNEYSSWESSVLLFGQSTQISPSLFGNQAQRRRWLKKNFTRSTFAPLLYFFYLYILKLGFLDGKSGFYYLIFKAIQMYHVKAKIYEIEIDRHNK
jgi:glycosyltransferase involved in cell wall biosynthesis